MGILTWIIFGIIAGALAKWIMPGRDGGGIIMTMILGIVGALVGGFISSRVFGMGDMQSFSFVNLIVAIIGSLLVLWIYRMVKK